MRGFKAGVIGAVLFLLLLWPSGGAWAGQPLEMAIVHVNDTHSHLESMQYGLKFKGKDTYCSLGGMARLKAKLDQVRAAHPNTLFLHAGDAVQGTIYFTKYHGKIEMDLLNMMGCDAMVLGNHEFDRGPAGTARIVGWAAFPVLAANMDASANPQLNGKTRPYVVKEIGGAKVGIIGLCLPDTPEVANTGPTLKFNPAAQTAEKYIAELKGQGVDKIILLTHQGFDQDLILARSVAGIDLIVGGHTHTLLGDKKQMVELGLNPESAYPTVVQGPDGGPVYVVQAWAWAKAVGVMQISFDAGGKITKLTGQSSLLVGPDFYRKGGTGKKGLLQGAALQEVNQVIAANPSIEIVKPDVAVIKTLSPYREGLAKLLTTVIAKVGAALDHIRVPGVSAGGVALPHGSLIAPVVAESMLWKMRTTGNEADLAWQNAGGVRTSLNPGDLTMAEAYSLMPFGNTLFVLELSGSELKAALEWAVSRGGGAFPYPAGFRYTADMKRPMGSRITSLEAAAAGGTWRKVSDAERFRMVTNSFAANGGDGAVLLRDTKGYRYDTGFVDAEVFIEYAKKMKVLEPPKTTCVTYLKGN